MDKLIAQKKAQSQSEKPDLTPKSPMLQFIQNLWKVRIIRFMFIGVLNTLFSYSLYAFLVFIGINYLWARGISIVIGIIFNFFTTGRIVFNNKDNWLIFRFVLVYAVTMTLDIFVLRKLVTQWNSNKYIAGALVTLPIALLSFLLNSIFTFKTIKIFNKPPKDTI